MDDIALPKDMAEAQRFLAELEEKDLDETLCSYPTCRKLRRSRPEKGGNIPAYCDNNDHTSLKSGRLRKSIEKLAQKGLKVPMLETEGPATATVVQSLGETALARMKQANHDMGLYIAAYEELGDAKIAAAQIEAAHHRADAQIALAQETIETERSLRLSAEHLRDTAQVARDTAQKDAQAAREETILAIAKMQESEERAQRRREEYQQHIAELQREQQEAIEAIRVEAQIQREAIQRQADQDLAQAQAATVAAQKEARRAETRAHDAETEARIAMTNAEQRVAEAHTALRREQEEVARLRQERDDAAAEARTRAEEDHKERQHLRAELAATTSHARVRAEDDRAEIQQLRASLLTATKRADDFTLSNDALRVQLIQLQMAGQEKPEKKE